MGWFLGGWVVQWVNGWPHVKSLKSNKSWPNLYNSITDILDIFWTFYLNHLSPLQGYFFNFDGNSYALICDYFSKFPFLYRAKTSFWSLRDRLIDLFSIEGYPDEIVSDNGPPFQSKEFAKFLSGLGIKHTTSSPGYPHSNGFIEQHIQTVKNMLSKSSNTRSFQEVLADLRTTRIGTGLPSPAEILHGRNLTTRAQAEIDIKAIHSVLQERQLKMMLDHDTSRRARKARSLMVGERCHVLGPGNKWIDAFVTGITDSGRSYETQVEATGGQLTRNRSHIRPRSPDIPHMHASFLQQNSVPSATSDGNAPSERENSVISGCQQLANGQKTVLSANHKGNIKQTNTSQVWVSETVPDRRVQPSRQAKKTRFEDNPVSSTVLIPLRRQPRRDTSTRNRRNFKLNVTDPDLLIPIKQTRVTTRHSDLREPQPSSSDSYPASLQPVTETTTSLLCLCPVPRLEAQAQRVPVPVALIVLHLRHHLRAAHSRLRMLRAQRQAVQPAHHGLHHQNCLRWSALSTPCSQVPETSKAIPWREVKWTTWETSSSVSPYWSKLPASHRTNQGLSQCLQLQMCHFPHIPEDIQVTRGLRSRCRQRMPTLSVRAVTQRQTDYKTFKRSLVDA